jgi:hypothetical protein
MSNFLDVFGQGVITFWQLLFVIASPDVFKSQNSDTYIVFGEAKVRLLSQFIIQRSCMRLE